MSKMYTMAEYIQIVDVRAAELRAEADALEKTIESSYHDGKWSIRFNKSKNQNGTYVMTISVSSIAKPNKTRFFYDIMLGTARPWGKVRTLAADAGLTDRINEWLASTVEVVE